jgi:hypothetical protein
LINPAVAHLSALIYSFIAGIHWYHSLSPGMESLHVMGGLFGAIVVDPLVPADTLPAAMMAMRRTPVRNEDYSFHLR